MIKTAEEWITYAKGRNRSIFFYNGRALDLTAFMFQHPGGRKILTHYTFKDITETIFNVFPHKREQTIQVLLRYVVGSVKKSEDKVKSSSNISEKKLGSPTKDKKKVLFDKKL
jgi:cytochrome b involved in lipid metabolism